MMSNINQIKILKIYTLQVFKFMSKFLSRFQQKCRASKICNKIQLEIYQASEFIQTADRVEVGSFSRQFSKTSQLWLFTGINLYSLQRVNLLELNYNVGSITICFESVLYQILKLVSSTNRLIELLVYQHVFKPIVAFFTEDR